jgi:hypothetical protein
MKYIPSPIDTSGTNIPGHLRELIEFLAKNTHETWAAQRISDGWTFGTKRDDLKKEHPDLIPYENLPESEKEYDRKTVIEVLKAIIAMGYIITKNIT